VWLRRLRNTIRASKRRSPLSRQPRHLAGSPASNQCCEASRERSSRRAFPTPRPPSPCSHTGDSGLPPPADSAHLAAQVRKDPSSCDLACPELQNCSTRTGRCPPPHPHMYPLPAANGGARPPAPQARTRGIPEASHSYHRSEASHERSSRQASAREQPQSTHLTARRMQLPPVSLYPLPELIEPRTHLAVSNLHPTPTHTPDAQADYQRLQGKEVVHRFESTSALPVATQTAKPTEGHKINQVPVEAPRAPKVISLAVAGSSNAGCHGARRGVTSLPSF
jgi:hypothetical protein